MRRSAVVVDHVATVWRKPASITSSAMYIMSGTSGVHLRQVD
jgi:hypothetical protein